MVQKIGGPPYSSPLSNDCLKKQCDQVQIPFQQNGIERRVMIFRKLCTIKQIKKGKVKVKVCTEPNSFEPANAKSLHPTS